MCSRHIYNKQVVKQLKESITYRSEHMKIIDEFLRAIRHYFLEKYDFHVRTLTGVTWFAIEKDYYYYSTQEHFMEDRDFKFTLKVLLDFCEEFDCEFDRTTCDNSRHIFTYNDVDMSNAFVVG